MVSVFLPSDALSQHLPSYLGFSYLGRGVSLPGCSSKVQLLLLTLDMGHILTAATPDLGRGISPLSHLTLQYSLVTIVWPQVNNREGTQLHPRTENWITELLSTAPPIRPRHSFPLSQSLPSGSFHKLLILIPQRADRLETTITEN